MAKNDGMFRNSCEHRGKLTKTQVCALNSENTAINHTGEM